MADISYRLAGKDDVTSIMGLYQKSRKSSEPDVLFLDYRRLESVVLSETSIWMLAEQAGRQVAVVSALIDREQRLCKIMRLMADPEIPEVEATLRAALRHFLTHLKTKVGGIEIIYTTTFSISLDQQEITLAEGFKIMGVFPNALGADKSKLNGLTVHYADGVIDGKRYHDFALHRLIQPFFAICREQIALPELREPAVAEIIQQTIYEPMPPLEMIRAPLLIARRFKNILERRSEVVNFYPFYQPNAMICDPEQKIEIYLKTVEHQRFAAIIGEHLETSIHPVELYKTVLQLLRDNGVSYVEIINDAADVFGIQCILDAGFTPCAYIPAFKRQGETRRDYVVFSRSFEYLCRPDMDLERGYLAFFKQYFKLERRNYFGKKM